MPGGIADSNDDFEQSRKGSSKETSQIAFVGGNRESNDSVATGEPLRRVQTEELRSLFLELDGLRNGSSGGVRKHRSELVSSDEVFLVDQDGSVASVSEELRHFHGGHHFVLSPQLTRSDPFKWTTDCHVPDAIDTMVTESVTVVPKDPVARGHHDRGHAIRFHLQHRPFIPAFRDRQNRPEPASVRQDAISPSDARYLDWASVGCNERIGVKAQGGRCDKTSDSSLAEFLLDDASLTIRQSGVVEGGAPLDALSEPSSDRGGLVLLTNHRSGDFSQMFEVFVG